MPVNDWREKRAAYGATVDIALQGCYDLTEIGWHLEERKPAPWYKKLDHMHDMQTVASCQLLDGSRADHVRMCFLCKEVDHIHQISVQRQCSVLKSPMRTREYNYYGCTVCDKTVLCLQHINGWNKETLKDEAIKEGDALLQTYLGYSQFDSFLKRIDGSAYYLELPIWVGYQLQIGRSKRARAMLELIREDHHINDIVLEEVAGTCSCGNCGYDTSDYNPGQVRWY